MSKRTDLQFFAFVLKVELSDIVVKLYVIFDISDGIIFCKNQSIYIHLKLFGLKTDISFSSIVYKIKFTDIIEADIL